MDRNTDIEQSILATFLFANDMGDDLSKTFILDKDMFTTSLTKRLVEVINDETVSDKMYGFQCASIDDDIKGTQFEHEWLQILSQTSISLLVAQRLYAKLVKKMKQRIAMGVN